MMRYLTPVLLALMLCSPALAISPDDDSCVFDCMINTCSSRDQQWCVDLINKCIDEECPGDPGSGGGGGGGWLLPDEAPAAGFRWEALVVVAAALGPYDPEDDCGQTQPVHSYQPSNPDIDECHGTAGDGSGFCEGDSTEPGLSSDATWSLSAWIDYPGGNGHVAARLDCGGTVLRCNTTAPGAFVRIGKLESEDGVLGIICPGNIFGWEERTCF